MKIGIYDSGIGGLTTLKVLLEKFHDFEYVYFADNANHPFGNKTQKEICNITSNGITRLKKHCDICVVACNTASSACDDKDVVKLLPPVEGLNPNATLLMATPFTQESIKDFAGKRAETRELATIIEVQAHLSARSNKLDMKETLPYIAKTVFPFRGVETVVLGCSHYPFCKAQIRKVLGDVKFVDGNQNLCRNLENKLLSYGYVNKCQNAQIHTLSNENMCINGDKSNNIANKTYALTSKNSNTRAITDKENDLLNKTKIDFIFSGYNDRKAYEKILKLLLIDDTV